MFTIKVIGVEKKPRNIFSVIKVEKLPILNRVLFATHSRIVLKCTKQDGIIILTLNTRGSNLGANTLSDVSMLT